MIDEKIIKLLSKVYSHSNEESYDFDKNVSRYQIPSNLKEKDILLLENSNFEINKIVHYQHDNVVKELKKIVTENDLELMVFNFFIKAIGTGLHRGL